ncbi:MAG: hypothetical protein NUV84_03020 [Candidatus Uhrbacteria bacterium]|nr:hypothetical protein [Candidatus Uhrbacteria bacterium]
MARQLFPAQPFEEAQLRHMFRNSGGIDRSLRAAKPPMARITPPSSLPGFPREGLGAATGK